VPGIAQGHIVAGLPESTGFGAPVIPVRARSTHAACHVHLLTDALHAVHAAEPDANGLIYANDWLNGGPDIIKYTEAVPLQ
jgi:hypothetical protein